MTLAIGDIVGGGDRVKVCLLAATTSANSAPSGAAAGLNVDTLQSAFPNGLPRDLTVLLESTAGSGTMTLSYVRIWGYSSGLSTDAWFPLGTGTDAGKGYINIGLAFGETAADTIRHSEPLSNLWHFDRLYLELGTFGGTSPSFCAYLVANKKAGIA